MLNPTALCMEAAILLVRMPFEIPFWLSRDAGCLFSCAAVCSERLMLKVVSDSACTRSCFPMASLTLPMMPLPMLPVILAVMQPAKLPVILAVMLPVKLPVILAVMLPVKLPLILAVMLLLFWL